MTHTLDLGELKEIVMEEGYMVIPDPRIREKEWERDKELWISDLIEILKKEGYKVEKVE